MNNLDKEKYNQIIGDAYKNFVNTFELKSNGTRLVPNGNLGELNENRELLSQEEFINKIKTDDEFDKKWGLKIEERELSLEERKEILYSKFRKGPIIVNGESYIECAPTDINFEFFNIPTKLITLTYNNETIEVYE